MDVPNSYLSSIIIFWENRGGRGGGVESVSQAIRATVPSSRGGLVGITSVEFLFFKSVFEKKKWAREKGGHDRIELVVQKASQPQLKKVF